MLIAEYNYNEDIRVQRAEAAEEADEKRKAAEKEAASAKKEADSAKEQVGKEKAARMKTVQKLYERGESIETIAEICDFTPEEVSNIVKMEL